MPARLQRVRRPLGELTGAFAERVRAAAADADLVHLEETETAWCDEGIDKPSLVHLHYLARLDRGLGAPWSKQFREVLDATRAERAAVRQAPLGGGELTARGCGCWGARSWSRRSRSTRRSTVPRRSTALRPPG